jgi:uncharacterized protein YggE
MQGEEYTNSIIINNNHMDQKIRNGLGAAGLIAMLVLAYAAVQYVGVYSRSIEPSSFRSFSVSGEGKVVAVPDIAQFSLELITEGEKNLGATQKINTEQTNKVITFLKDKGVDAKDIISLSYNVEPRYQYYNCNGDGELARPCPPPTIVGYTVRHSVQVRVRDFSKIGDLLSGVVSAGANSVSQLSFTIDDPTELRNQARAEAIAKAKATAAATAKAGGFTLGRLLGIDEGGGGIPYYYGRETMAAAPMGKGGDMMAPMPSIEPGSQDIQITVMLRYEIE